MSKNNTLSPKLETNKVINLESEYRIWFHSFSLALFVIYGDGFSH